MASFYTQNSKGGTSKIVTAAILVQEGGSAVVEEATGLTFDASEFNVSDAGGGIASISLAGALGGATDLGDLGDVTITTPADGELLRYDGAGWVNNTLAEAGVAAASHTHDAADINSGTLADARVAQSNVTQHEGALTVTASQVSDFNSAADARVAAANIDDLNNVVITTPSNGEYLQFDGTNWINAASGATIDVQEGGTSVVGAASALNFDADDFDVTDETGGVAGVALAGDTLDQHASTNTKTTPDTGDYVIWIDPDNASADLRIYGQTKANFESYLNGALSFLSDITGENIDDLNNVVLTTPSNGEVLKFDGTNWVNAADDTTGGALNDLSDVVITSVASGEIVKFDGTNWVNNTLAEAGIAAASHTHAAADITSGTFADARIAQSNVTQHEGAITITESQISDFGSYETADADILKADVGDTLTAGYVSDVYDHGTVSSGTVTPAPGTGQESFQKYTSNGAHTLAPPANSCNVTILITMGGTGAAPTTTGFTVVDGDSFTTAQGDKFICYITKIDTVSYLSVKALQ